MKKSLPLLAFIILILALLAAGCATAVPMGAYNPLETKPLPQAGQITICVQPFEDLTKNGFTNKKWVGSRYNALGLLERDYELKTGSISEVVTQAVADELAARGFKVITGGEPPKDCQYIIKGRVKNFWCKFFFDVTTSIKLEAELIDAETGRTIWLKQEQKDSFEEPNELLVTREQEPLWIGEVLRRSRDYLIRKLFRDERFLYLVTKKVS